LVHGVPMEWEPATLPDSIGELTEMSSLLKFQPATIPDSIGDLTELTYLNIQIMHGLVGGLLLY
jgi:hypothetical protein